MFTMTDVILHENSSSRQQQTNIPEAQEQHVVEFVFTECSGDGDEEGLPKQCCAGVVVPRLFFLLP